MHRRVAAAAVGLCLLAAAAHALDFEMGVQTKCVYEEINANVIVVGDYKAYNKDNPSIPVAVDVMVGERRGRLRLAALARRSRALRCLLVLHGAPLATPRPLAAPLCRSRTTRTR